MPALDMSDIQGLVLRGYRMPLVRYFILEVLDATLARAGLGATVAGGDTSRMPQVTDSRDWGEAKPPYCLNIGVTWTGLQALGVTNAPGVSFDSFRSFRLGAAARAAAVGDHGSSAPDHWGGGLGSGRDHLLLCLYARDDEALTLATDQLRGVFVNSGACAELGLYEGRALPDSRVHFGYRDGISQPAVEGAGGANPDDNQPASAAWNFVLVPDDNSNYYVPTPPALGLNGSFAVFRVIEQDVDGFEEFLQSQKDRIDPELLAAKLCGRWRNGTPLALSPDTDAPSPPLHPNQLNSFDYVPSPFNPTGIDDTQGARCPIGSHIRRLNPRGETVAGGGNRLHRIIRRGMPYGPPYDPKHPRDGQARGLLGFFINASIESQFEFLMMLWTNDGGFAGGLAKASKDPLVGDNDPSTSIFQIPGDTPATTKTLTGLGRFIVTRGAAYCFLPSLTAIRFIASL